MILFNLMFFKDTSNYFRSFSIDSSHLETNIKKTYKSVKKNTSLAYIFKNPEILSESKQDLARKDFIKQKMGQKFVNNLWRQKVFLSINNKALNKYNVGLNSISMNQRQNMHKYLVSKFSKALFEGSIQSSLLYDIGNSKSSLSSVQYLWGKTLQLQFLKMSSVLYNSEYQKNIKKLQNIINNNIDLNHLPLFTISNHLGQMIISEPPTEFNVSKYVKSYISTMHQNNNIYHGFFFTNYEDAQEYMLYIQRYYNLDNKKLKIFTCNFSTFYKIMNKFDREIYFRLIPDLQEVGELIKKYRYYSNVSFHASQKYSKTYFQGQPLYFIKNGKNEVSYSLSKKEQSQKYNLIFTNYSEALQVCNKLQNQVPNSQYHKPHLIVYNLEHFIKDQLSSNNITKDSFLVVPSKKSYMFTKQHQLKKSSESAYNTCIETISYIKLWSKRIFWSLTSRKP